MASRYENNETQKLKNGRNVYRTRIYPNIPKTDKDIYIVTQTGDRLDTLANQFYGDSSLWWIIATANNIHDATFAVEDGTTLRVPENYTKIINDFQK
jgi:nucleoid-associated protein YgaU